jgi:ketosteroid isomerase-like protein
VSQENVEIVRALQPSGVDLMSFLNTLQPSDARGTLFTDDFESTFTSQDGSLPTRKGFEGFVAGWQDWLEGWGRYEIWAEDFIDAGDQVVVFVRVNATTRRDRVEMEHTPAAVWTLRNGIVRSVHFYYDRHVALKAAGLEE